MVPARGRCVVKTDLAIKVPKGTYGRVAPRSGLAVKNFIDTGAGVVDEDYRGNLGVVLFNHSDVDFPGGWVGGCHEAVPPLHHHASMQAIISMQGQGALPAHAAACKPLSYVPAHGMLTPPPMPCPVMFVC